VLLTFYKPIQETDSITYEKITFYEEDVKLWASRAYKSAQERHEGRQQVSTQIEEYYIRYNPDIKPTWRLLDPDYGTMSVIGVQVYGRKNGLLITAELKDNDNDNNGFEGS